MVRQLILHQRAHLSRHLSRHRIRDRRGHLRLRVLACALQRWSALVLLRLLLLLRRLLLLLLLLMMLCLLLVRAQRWIRRRWFWALVRNLLRARVWLVLEMSVLAVLVSNGRCALRRLLRRRCLSGCRVGSRQRCLARLLTVWLLLL